MKRVFLSIGCLLILFTMYGCTLKENTSQTVASDSRFVGKNKNTTTGTDTTETETEETEVDQLQLTNDEMITWVKTFLVDTDRWVDGYQIKTTIDVNDGMLYAQVGKPQTGSAYVFRVNAFGELEGKIAAPLKEFHVVEKKYLVMYLTKEEVTSLFEESTGSTAVVNTFDEALEYVLKNEMLWNKSNYKIEGHSTRLDFDKLHINENGEFYSVGVLIDQLIPPQKDQGELNFVVYKDGRLDQQIKPTGIHFMILIDPINDNAGKTVDYSELSNGN